jgi:N-acetylglucosaminyldiphosphoundecaprenol N-acetyl-beta-D-mannosaminyltransferase
VTKTVSGGRYPVLGVGVDAVSYETAIDMILSAARERRGLGVSALAVHGVMTGALDAEHRHRLNSLELVVPDGQPVRWALRWLHGVRLGDRVRGPTLMLRLCEHAAREGLPVYLYGSRAETLQRLRERLQRRIPALTIAGTTPSAFRCLSDPEHRDVLERIRSSGARIAFVGLGCPRQEIFTFENRLLLELPVVAVGAAFDFHAGTLPEAPEWVQRSGLEWLFRLASEPRRLWRRYLLLNPLYLAMVAAQSVNMLRLDRGASEEPRTIRPG